ncbi:hypothetical protein CPAV1605_475 [seawater metagenome]|uniref:Uncharacterized protein n=1 Tax=seawater metagenome TaxID=1561972 RepID=A0A5E8CM22_9ZZZZ
MYTNYSPTKSVYSSTAIKEEKDNDKLNDQIKNLSLSEKNVSSNPK